MNNESEQEQINVENGNNNVGIERTGNGGNCNRTDEQEKLYNSMKMVKWQKSAEKTQVGGGTTV